MSNPKISVIIPVYNIEDYLDDTMMSLLNQSMIDDLEVLLIDDGSTDNSRYIIEKYALDYDNFYAYHKDNGGPGIARNFALTKAKGDYIHFLDADDYLPPNAYERLYNLGLENNNDIIVGNVLRFARYNIWEESLFINAFNEVKEDIGSISLLEMPSLLWDSFTTNKLYKRDFIIENDIKFLDEKIFFEDLLFSLEAYILADSIAISKDVFYYWRLRSNNSSVTQSFSEISNFKDRMTILKLIIKLFEEYDVNDELYWHEYFKWVNHDLKFFIKRFNHYPEEHHQELFMEIRELVEMIPEELIESLNTYKRVVFTMIKNNDFENFLKFAPLENELYENPEIPTCIDEKYHKYFDFNKAMEEENLFVYICSITNDDENIFLTFREVLNYLSDDVEYEISSSLIDEDNSYPLKVEISEEKQIIVPVSLIKDKNHLKIKVTLKFNNFEKTTYLKARYRKSIDYDDFYIDFNRVINSYLVIDVRPRRSNEIRICDISFDLNQFKIKGCSKNRISTISMENIIDFEKIIYPVTYCDDSSYFEFIIPYNDILKTTIKKWELNSDEYPNTISVARDFRFMTRTSRINFLDTRNKVLIEDDVCNINSLNCEILTLKEENEELSAKLSEFRSRKIVRTVDSIKNLFAKRGDDNE